MFVFLKSFLQVSYNASGNSRFFFLIMAKKKNHYLFRP